MQSIYKPPEAAERYEWETYRGTLLKKECDKSTGAVHANK